MKFVITDRKREGYQYLRSFLVCGGLPYSSPEPDLSVHFCGYPDMALHFESRERAQQLIDVLRWFGPALDVTIEELQS